MYSAAFFAASLFPLAGTLVWWALSRAKR